MGHPYETLDQTAFWKSGVVEESPTEMHGIHRPKWPIPADWQIATAGSCFAQHISRHLRNRGFSVLDSEPAPAGLPQQSHHRFGYSMYSARTGNIYTIRQLLQLVQEVAELRSPTDWIWERDGRFFDALRPGVEPEGLDSPEDVQHHRHVHLTALRALFTEMDLFIFTLGLTEAWMHAKSRTIFPIVPGSIAGQFKENQHAFHNATFQQCMTDFQALRTVLSDLRGPRGEPHFLLTVSPVPLTASASGHHVLQATTHSKAILRAVAGQLAAENAHIDYFPSYEIVTNPAAKGAFYAPNLRSVRPAGVQSVMDAFFHHYPGSKDIDRSAPSPQLDDETTCEEALLEAFGP